LDPQVRSCRFESQPLDRKLYQALITGVEEYLPDAEGLQGLDKPRHAVDQCRLQSSRPLLCGLELDVNLGHPLHAVPWQREDLREVFFVHRFQLGLAGSAIPPVQLKEKDRSQFVFEQIAIPSQPLLDPEVRHHPARMVRISIVPGAGQGIIPLSRRPQQIALPEFEALDG
jgi:hypothetical protein